MAAPKEMAAPKSPQSGFDEVEEMKDAPELSIDDSVNLAEYQGKTVVLDNLYNKLTLLSAQVNKGKEQREQVYVFELSSRIIKLKSKVNDLKTQKNKLRAEMQKFLKINKLEKQLTALKTLRETADAGQVFGLSAQIRTRENIIKRISTQVNDLENGNKISDLKIKLQEIKNQFEEQNKLCKSYESKLEKAQNFLADQEKLRIEIQKVNLFIRRLNTFKIIPNFTKSIPGDTTLGTIKKTTDSLLKETKGVGSLEKEAAKQNKLLQSARNIIDSTTSQEEDDLEKIRTKIQAAIADARALRKRLKDEQNAAERELPNWKLQLRF